MFFDSFAVINSLEYFLVLTRGWTGNFRGEEEKLWNFNGKEKNFGENLVEFNSYGQPKNNSENQNLAKRRYRVALWL
jgi:hypothetical protein